MEIGDARKETRFGFLKGVPAGVKFVRMVRDYVSTL